MTGGDTNGSSDVAKAAYQLPRQRHDMDLVILHGLPSTRRTSSLVRSSENSTSSPSSNSKIAMPYHIPYDVSLVQNMSREEPMVINDHMDHDDLMLIGFDLGDGRDQIGAADYQATLKNVPSSSGISLPPIRQLFDHSMEPQDATHRWGYLPTNPEWASPLPSLSSSYGTPPQYYTTPGASSTMTCISEPDSDLTPAFGSYSRSHENSWQFCGGYAEPSSSTPEFDAYEHRTNYIELEDDLGPRGRSEVSSQPSNEVGDLMDRCSECDKVFTGRYRKGNLRRHVLASHKPFPSATATTCRVCRKDFKRTDATRKHEWKNHRLPDAKPKKRKEPWSGPIVQ